MEIVEANAGAQLTRRRMSNDTHAEKNHEEEQAAVDDGRRAEGPGIGVVVAVLLHEREKKIAVARRGGI
jgi:hypothetical protein